MLTILKEHIKKNKICYQDIQTKTGISLDTLKSIFSRKTKNPGFNTISQIADAVGLKLSFSDAYEYRIEGTENTVIIIGSGIERKFYKLNPENMDLIDKLLKQLAENKKTRPEQGSLWHTDKNNFI